MPELTFQIRGAEAVGGIATPAVALHMEISNTPASEVIQTVVLNCQIQIEATRRRYGDAEQSRLRDLFDEPERWGQTLRPLHWTNLTTTVPGFAGCIGMKLAVPCTFDFNVTATKYFHALAGGTVPLTLLFSGTIFYRTPSDQLQAAPIPWDTEARFAMPADIWKEAVDLHHPNTAWLGLRRDNFDRLYDFKVRHGFATFDEAVERMLEHAVEAGA
jgi:Family of unknown function (DUF6084)